MSKKMSFPGLKSRCGHGGVSRGSKVQSCFLLLFSLYKPPAGSDSWPLPHTPLSPSYKGGLGYSNMMATLPLTPWDFTSLLLSLACTEDRNLVLNHSHFNTGRR